jgi:ATP-dependent RNA circularization protein (DNA/RNA ligase family)
MLFCSKLYIGLLYGVVAVTMLATLQSASAEDLTHMVSGVVKHVDKDTKTMVVKTADGTEHTIKYTDKTAIEGAKDAGGDVKKGAHVSVKYTEEGGEKTAVGVKDLGKKVDK